MAWRFISYQEHTAAYNMAADEAILNAHLAGQSPPTLRIYGFNPPAVSLGANQKLPHSVVQRIQDAGFDVVRRPSGGRAVLHLGDLTYSFIGTAAIDKSHITSEHFLFPSVNGAYQQICAGLVLAFKRLGLTLELGHSAPGVGHYDCFAATTYGDLHVGGVKVIGSAQLRRSTAVLQHGTIILCQDPRIIESLLLQSNGSLSEAPPRSAVARHANLYDLLGRQPAMHELEAAILHGFQDAFGVKFTVGSLIDLEQNNANQQAKFVYCERYQV